MTKGDKDDLPTLTLDEATPEAIAKRLQALRSLIPPTAKTLTDADLVRFLVARQFHIERTVEMVSVYVKWRSDFKIDAIPMPGPGVPYLMSIRKFATIPDVNYEIDHPNLKEEFKKFRAAQGGGGLHGVSKDGLPLMIERLGGYQVRRLAQLCPPEVFKDFNIVTNEFVFNVVMGEAQERKGAPVGQVILPLGSCAEPLTYNTSWSRSLIALAWVSLNFTSRYLMCCLSLKNIYSQCKTGNYAPKSLGRTQSKYVPGTPWETLCRECSYILYRCLGHHQSVA